MESYSVLMTVYYKDNPEFVKQGIDSMLSQTILTDDFVLVCDGTLTDELNFLIRNYEINNKKIFHVVRIQNNIGLGAALRYGLPLCKNRLVARMDNDDIASSNRCEKELKFFENNPDVSIVGSYVAEFENSINDVIRLKEVPTDLSSIILFSKKRNPFNHSTVMLDKNKILSIGNYSEMRTNQDVELWVRALNNGLIGANIPEALVYFRFDIDTYKRRKNLKNVKLMIKVWKDFYKNHYCSYMDFLSVVVIQYCVALAPTWLIRWAYDNLR